MSLLKLTKKELRLMKVGLGIRDIHNVKMINESTNKNLISNCRQEHHKIKKTIDKINNVLADTWYDEDEDIKVKIDTEAKENDIKYLSMKVDIDIDEAMNKLERVKELMLDIDKIKEELTRKTHIFQAKDMIKKDIITSEEDELSKKLKSNVVIIPAQYEYLGIDHSNNQNDITYQLIKEI